MTTWRTTFSIVLALIFVASCSDSDQRVQDEQKDVSDSTMVYGTSYRFPEVSADARDIVAQWAVFSDFQLEATDLGGRSKRTIFNKTERIIAHTDSLKKSMPDTLKTLPIYSRLIVAETRARLLHQEAAKEVSDSLMIVNGLNEMNLATASLIIQINEKFQKDRIDEQRRGDEQKELELQKSFLDSVEQAELADQNRERSVTNR